MANETLTLIQKVTVGATSVSSVTFSNIPQTYTDLKVVVSARTNRSGFIYDNIVIYPNGSSSNLSGRYLLGYSTGVGSYTDSGGLGTAAANGDSATSNTFTNAEIYISNYTNSSYKSFFTDAVLENNTANDGRQALTASLWSNTAAITSLQISPSSGPNFVQYSTFYLYGIAKYGSPATSTGSPYATGGDSITYDGTNWVHTFYSTGTFTPLKALSNVDYLVVAGGGGGGYNKSGGGGAGGLRSTVTATGGGGSLESKLSLSAQAYTITVGAGGSGSTLGTVKGTTGGNSSISGTGLTTVTSNGGGGGGSYDGTTTYFNGVSGGSGGGGAGGDVSPAGTGGSGTSNQGYAGGTGAYVYAGGAGAGGGGAGAVGGNATTSGNATGTGGNGGNGVAVSITGSSVYYAGGGAGANFQNNTTDTPTGGLGGGGNGGKGTNTDGGNGTANLGGGGGANQYRTSGTTTGGNGGSGVVIIRYAG